MLRTVLWIAAGCVVALAILAIIRGIHFTSQPVKPAPEPAPAVAEVAAPVVAKAPAPPKPAPPPPAPRPYTDEERQVQEDAAAVGLTTREPADDPAAPEEKKPE